MGLRSSLDLLLSGSVKIRNNWESILDSPLQRVSICPNMSIHSCRCTSRRWKEKPIRPTLGFTWSEHPSKKCVSLFCNLEKFVRRHDEKYALKIENAKHENVCMCGNPQPEKPSQAFLTWYTEHTKEESSSKEDDERWRRVFLASSPCVFLALKK